MIVQFYIQKQTGELRTNVCILHRAENEARRTNKLDRNLLLHDFFMEALFRGCLTHLGIQNIASYGFTPKEVLREVTTVLRQLEQLKDKGFL